MVEVFLSKLQQVLIVQSLKNTEECKCHISHFSTHRVQWLKTENTGFFTSKRWFVTSIYTFLSRTQKKQQHTVNPSTTPCIPIHTIASPQCNPRYKRTKWWLLSQIQTGL